MRKATVYLPDHLKAGLEREAGARGVSEATLIREALVRAITRPRPRGGLFTAAPFAEHDERALEGFGER